MGMNLVAHPTHPLPILPVDSRLQIRTGMQALTDALLRPSQAAFDLQLIEELGSQGMPCEWLSLNRKDELLHDYWKSSMPNWLVVGSPPDPVLDRSSARA
jgi:hypothetical protein